MNLRLLFKLALLPLIRSWFLLGLMMISFAQLMLALWFCGSIQKELSHTQAYASTAKFLTIQMKDESASIFPIQELLQGTEASVEELKTEDVLKRMEEEEPEVVQTVRAIGNEGLQLVPRMLTVRGNIPDETIEKIKLMTEVYRVDSTPVHHARLNRFYKHLSFEMNISILLITFLVLVQLLVFQRIQSRDSAQVMRDLLAWGVGSMQARVPGFLSILSLSGFSILFSIGEWFAFRKWIWKNNTFLGELSLEHNLSFPFLFVMITFFVMMAVALLLSFSGRTAEE
ncbi:MAG: hypothetical protein H7333_00155 [Bdellovibrionales bacterium]|nr:hypothetical protein [Oligoflexia bacterium]